MVLPIRRNAIDVLSNVKSGCRHQHGQYQNGHASKRKKLKTSWFVWDFSTWPTQYAARGGTKWPGVCRGTGERDCLWVEQVNLEESSHCREAVARVLASLPAGVTCDKRRNESGETRPRCSSKKALQSCSWLAIQRINDTSFSAQEMLFFCNSFPIKSAGG